MTVSMTDGWLDGTSDLIIATANRVTVCAGAPANIAAITTNLLASAALVPGDFTKANGDTNGRKLTTAGKPNITITNSGSGDHIAIDDGTNFKVYDCAALTLVAGQEVNIPALVMNIPDPVAVP